MNRSLKKILTISAIAIYVGDKILEHYIQEEIWVKRILHKIFPPKTFRSELYKTIDETIKEYELSHSYNKNGNQFPFYHSQVLTDILSKHILFAKSQICTVEFFCVLCYNMRSIKYKEMEEHAP